MKLIHLAILLIASQAQAAPQWHKVVGAEPECSTVYTSSAVCGPECLSREPSQDCDVLKAEGGKLVEDSAKKQAKATKRADDEAKETKRRQNKADRKVRAANLKDRSLSAAERDEAIKMLIKEVFGED